MKLYHGTIYELSGTLPQGTYFATTIMEAVLFGKIKALDKRLPGDMVKVYEFALSEEVLSDKFILATVVSENCHHYQLKGNTDLGNIQHKELHSLETYLSPLQKKILNCEEVESIPV